MVWGMSCAVLDRARNSGSANFGFRFNLRDFLRVLLERLLWAGEEQGIENGRSREQEEW